MILNHTSIDEDWDVVEIHASARTLILGSFNPYNPNGDNADFYYGRCTNYLWKVIAQQIGRNQNYFLNNLQHKLEIMREKEFCFLDVIDSIEVLAENNQVQVERAYVQQKIHTEFSDQVLFTSKTKFNNTRVFVSRNYNQRIVPFINQSNIQRIIHTMGNNTIDLDFKTKWKEHNLGLNGFQGFIRNIVNQDIEFIPQSLSPSGRAVRVGGDEYIIRLGEWLNEYLELN